MTKRLSGIWHAWHFRFALGLVIKSLCGSFCIACLHPLTRRYMPVIRKSIAEMISSLKVLRSFTGSLRILVGTLAI
ncbi:DUF3265 domain-containing protein [Vibrio parahaemolyticus]|nr:DUF3265 domain-containing protein [Vibrio parahaemolyticus]